MASDHRSHHPPLTAGHLLLLILTASAGHSLAQPPSSDDGTTTSFRSATFSPSMAIVIVVLISTFFFLGFFSIYIRQCSGDRSIRNAAVAAAGGRSRRPRGLAPEALDSFPTFLYSEVKERKIGKGSLECAVCLSEFEDDETLRLLPKCSHVFHLDCIDAWLAAHVTCPVCRSNLVPDPTPIGDEVEQSDSQRQPGAAAVVVDQIAAGSSDLGVAGQEDQVSIEIHDHDDGAEEEEEQQHQQVIEDLERFVNMKRAKSRARPAMLARSHSTGHSLVRPGENLDRFTLRLPEDVRREILETTKLRRTRSLLVFDTEGSSRRGYRGEGSVGRAGPRIGSFFTSLSVRNWGRRGDGEGSAKGGSSRGGFFRRGEPDSAGSVKGARFNGVMAPFDCYGGGKSVVEEKEDVSSTSALNRV